MSRTTHTMPTPAVAGWTETERIQRAKAVREDFERKGGRVIQERRVRNIAFDEPGERTTYIFVVDWDAAPASGVGGSND